MYNKIKNNQLIGTVDGGTECRGTSLRQHRAADRVVDVTSRQTGCMYLMAAGRCHRSPASAATASCCCRRSLGVISNNTRAAPEQQHSLWPLSTILPAQQLVVAPVADRDPNLIVTGIEIITNIFNTNYIIVRLLFSFS